MHVFMCISTQYHPTVELECPQPPVSHGLHVRSQMVYDCSSVQIPDENPLVNAKNLLRNGFELKKKCFLRTSNCISV